MKKYKAKIRGIVPLMIAACKPENFTKAKEKQKGTIYDAVKQANDYLYRNTKGEVYVPSSHIEGAMIKTGSKFPIAGAGKKTYKDRMKTVLVYPIEMPLRTVDIETGEWVDAKDFIPGKIGIIDERIARIPGGGKIMVARPRWDEWEISFEIRVMDEDLISGDVVKRILETAGREQGIGTYRPKFGLFELIDFKEIKV